jgi:hypothetical protein
MSGRVIDAENGIVTKLHDLKDGRFVMEKVSDVSAIIEANKRQYNAVDRSARMGDLVHVGRVDAVVMDRWCKEDGINYLAPENKGLLLKKLEQRENRMFKTHPGKFA